MICPQARAVPTGGARDFRVIITSKVTSSLSQEDVIKNSFEFTTSIFSLRSASEFTFLRIVQIEEGETVVLVSARVKCSTIISSPRKIAAFRPQTI